MKKLLMVLCIVIMFFGIVGCPSSDDPANTLGQQSFSSTSVTTTNTVDSVSDSDIGSPVPEPGTLILLGAGLVGLAGFGRKKFKK